MRVLLTLLLLAPVTAAATGAPLPLTDARSLLEAKEYDEIFIAFSSLDAGEHPDGDAAIASVVMDAAQASRQADDLHLAIGLAGIARRLNREDSNATLLFAKLAIKLEMRGAAAQALDEGLLQAPTDGELLFQRAHLAEMERELQKAADLYGRVPKAHPRHGDARDGASRMKEASSQQDAVLEQVAEVESAFLEQQEAAGRRMAQERRRPTPRQDDSAGRATSIPAPVPIPSQRATSPNSAPAGMEATGSRNFRIVYHRGDRDFAQRADFEVRVLSMLEDARQRVGNLFNHYPEEPVEVVLYTAEEFALHFGGQLGQNVLGFYAGKIRINRAENPHDPMFRRTVVHEYVHALVDQMAAGNVRGVPLWLNEGLAVWTEHRVTGANDESELPFPQRRRLRQYAQSISLDSLARPPFGACGNQMAAYIKSRAAVEALVGTGGGLGRVLRVIELIGRGRQFEQAFSEVFGDSRLERLDEQANRQLEE